MSPTFLHRGFVLLALCGAVVLPISACRVGGGNPASSPVATSPRGATLTIDWRESRETYWSDTAELLAVSDSGLYLLHGRHIVLYRFGSDARLRSMEAPTVETVDLREPEEQEVQDLAAYARYPFGLDAVGLARLGEALGIDSVVVRRRP